MSITINGTGSITGLTAGGLPDGSITADDIASGAVTAAKLAAGAGGKILQVVQGVKTTGFSTTSTSYTDITGFSTTITPIAANSQILVIFDLLMGGNTDGATIYARLLRESTAIYEGTEGYAHPSAGGAYSGSPSNGPFAYGLYPLNRTFLDTPTYTLGNTISYKGQMKVNVGTGYFNRTAYTTGGYAFTTASGITLLEVAG